MKKQQKQRVKQQKYCKTEKTEKDKNLIEIKIKKRTSSYKRRPPVRRQMNVRLHDCINEFHNLLLHFITEKCEFDQFIIEARKANELTCKYKEFVDRINNI